MRRWMVVGTTVVAVVGLVACGGQEAAEDPSEEASHEEVPCEPVGDLADADTTVAVELSEFYIAPEPAEVAAGTIGFDLSNVGVDPHELVVIKTDTAPDALPTDDDGAVVEDDIDGEVIGEVEGFNEDSCHGVFDLDPGAYVLICNLVEIEDGEVEAHYSKGMRIAFDVTG